MTLSIQVDSYSLRSPLRKFNQGAFWPEPQAQDSIFSMLGPRALGTRDHLFILATGAGTPPHGLEACHLAIKGITEGFYGPVEVVSSDITERLQSSFQAANESVHEYIQSVSEDVQGCSVVAAVVSAGGLVVAHVGLCGAYLVRGETAHRVVPLPSLARSAEDSISSITSLLGSYKPLLARNEFTDPMLLNPFLELISGEKMRSGDVLILVSDGFLGLVEQGDMMSVVQSTPETAAQRLAEMICDSLHGSTNVAVTIIRCL